MAERLRDEQSEAVRSDEQWQAEERALARIEDAMECLADAAISLAEARDGLPTYSALFVACNRYVPLLDNITKTLHSEARSAGVVFPSETAIEESRVASLVTSSAATTLDILRRLAFVHARECEGCELLDEANTHLKSLEVA